MLYYYSSMTLVVSKFHMIPHLNLNNALLGFTLQQEHYMMAGSKEQCSL